MDYVVFRNYLDHEVQRLDFDAKSISETAAYVPFTNTVLALEESRKKTQPLKPQDAAAKLSAFATEIENSRRTLEQQLRSGNNNAGKVIGARAAANSASLRNTLRAWFSFHESYDPLFTWWAGES